jgi:hypothetical protein
VGLKIRPGANPTIVSYNASAVKIYDATSSLVRFGNKKYYLEKRSSLLQRWFEVVGLAPGLYKNDPEIR